MAHPTANHGTTRRIWQLAWPVSVSNLLQNLWLLTSLWVVGRFLGAEAVAARTVGMRVLFTLEVLVMAISTGAAALVARAWGAQDAATAARTARTALWMSLGASFALTVPVLLFAEQMAGAFNLSPHAAEMAATFIRWAGAGIALFALNFAPMAALRAAGDTITPMWMGAVTTAVGVGTVFLFVASPLQMGMLGVVLSVLASFAVSAALLVSLWRRDKLALKWGPRGGDFNWKRMKLLLKIGAPAGAESFTFSFGLVSFTWLVAKYGTAANAAYGIGVDLLALSFLLGFSFSVAASTLVGQRLGAGDAEGARRAGWRAMWLTVGVMTVFGALLVLFAEPLVRFFVPDDPEVVRLAVAFMAYLGGVQPLMAVEFTVAGALRGAGDTRFPMFSMMLGLAVRLLCGAAVWRLGYGVEWVYAALVPDYMVKAALLVWRFRGGGWVHAIRRDELERAPAFENSVALEGEIAPGEARPRPR